MASQTDAPNAVARRYAAKVVRHLEREYPDASCALVHQSPFELLVATILSAQCTDTRVNQVTAPLFQKYTSPAHFARATQSALERAIESTGFFRNKAKNIRACSAQLVALYDGQVPAKMDQLVALPGVGRKTANVVLGTAFGLATGVVVDTHVTRICRRLGLSREKDPVKIERDLVATLPRRTWIAFSHRVIAHGRQVCMARRPRCDACSMARFCPRVGVASKT